MSYGYPFIDQTLHEHDSPRGPMETTSGDDEYKACPASTTTTFGATGAAGDMLEQLWVIPATTSPGAVQVKDGSETAITVFTGGATSVADLKPFRVPAPRVSRTGAWQVICGANVSALAIGDPT